MYHWYSPTLVCRFNKMVLTFRISFLAGYPSSIVYYKTVSYSDWQSEIVKTKMHQVFWSTFRSKQLHYVFCLGLLNNSSMAIDCQHCPTHCLPWPPLVLWLHTTVHWDITASSPQGCATALNTCNRQSCLDARLLIKSQWTRLLANSLLHNNSEQVIYRYMPVTEQFTFWCWPQCGNALQFGKVTAGLVHSNSHLSPITYYDTSHARLMPWFQLRYDYDMTTMHHVCLPLFDAIRRQQKTSMLIFRHSRIVDVSQSNGTHIVILVTFIVVECVVVSFYRSWITIVI